MDLKFICTILAGITVLYAGILSLADDSTVGAGMVVLGGMVAAAPIWRTLRKPKAGSTRRTAAKSKRKTHLKVVDDRDKPPTYH
jgi:hypothetical protein